MFDNGTELEQADAWCESNCRESPDWMMNADPVTHEEVVDYSIGDRVTLDGNSACIVNKFHHSVAGITSAFYAVDFQDGVTSYEVVRPAQLDLLERASPWCNDDELLCTALCKEEGFCCNNPNVGSNQLLSCAQACMIRARGADEDACKDTCSAQITSRGCSREVNGHMYTMCSSCTDLSDSCPHGVQDHQHACHAGCAVTKERETCHIQPQDTCGEPGELCYFDPTCSDDTSVVYFGGLGCNAGGAAWNCRFCGFTSAGGITYPNCPIMEKALCTPTAHYSRADLFGDTERQRTAHICSSFWSINTCGQEREDLPCTEDGECTPADCPSRQASDGRCRNSGVVQGVSSGKCRWIGPEPVRCERTECTESIWLTEASNGRGTCGTQIEWVQDNENGMSELTDACTRVAQQDETPECAPCGPPSPLSPPPLLPVSCWDEARPGSTPGYTLAEKASASLEHCKHLCRAEESCKSVTFSASAHSCRLIDRRALAVLTADDAVVTNFNYALCFSPPVAGRSSGNLLGKRKAATHEACQRLCRKHPKCKSITFRATEILQGSAGTCVLMKAFYEGNFHNARASDQHNPHVSNFYFDNYCQHGVVSTNSFNTLSATTSAVNFQVCCDASCGTCGGHGCSQRNGGADACCISKIGASAIECIEVDQTRCIVPNVDNGEEACEGHGYAKDRCEEVGCCQYRECPIGDGSGECHSAVGQAECTPVEFYSEVEDLGLDRCSAAKCPAATFDNGEGTASAPTCESCYQLQPPCDDCVCPEFTAEIQAACTAACLAPTSGGMWDQVGSGWRLVRRIKAGYRWHPSTDRLSGVAVYGNKPAMFASTSDETFSVDFGEFDQFLFSTGDEAKWLVATKDAVLGTTMPEGFRASYANEARGILLSSMNDAAYTAKWYNRAASLEDPWVSLTDHEIAISAGNVLCTPPRLALAPTQHHAAAHAPLPAQPPRGPSAPRTPPPRFHRR